LRARALQFLARREHARHELERKLAPFAEDEAEVSKLLDEFAARGWLSEQRVVDAVVRAQRARFGSRRIRYELLKRGVEADRVATAVESLRAGDVAALRDVWRRKFGRVPRNAVERARQIRFLQSRGFELDMILRVIRSGDTDGDGE
jgi:regulatory protein